MGLLCVNLRVYFALALCACFLCVLVSQVDVNANANRWCGCVVATMSQVNVFNIGYLHTIMSTRAGTNGRRGSLLRTAAATADEPPSGPAVPCQRP